MRIYLDVSCLDRPTDDQSQTRIRLETEAPSLIFDRIDAGEWTQVASEIILIEIDAGVDAEKRRRARALLPETRQIAPLTDDIWSRAADVERMGFKPADAVHVAAAEAVGSDVLLTCDDRMLRTAERNRTKLRVRVANPLKWLQEQDHDTDS